MGVREQPATAYGDEPRVAVFGEDHNATILSASAQLAIQTEWHCVPSGLLGERNAGDGSTKAQKSLLQRDVVGLRIVATFCSVMEIATAYLGAAIVACRKPGLCCVAFLKIIRRTTPTHFRRHPARIDCVGVDI